MSSCRSSRLMLFNSSRHPPAAAHKRFTTKEARTLLLRTPLPCLPEDKNHKDQLFCDVQVFLSFFFFLKKNLPFRSTKFLWNLAVVLAARGFSQHFSAQPALRFPPSWVPPPFCCSGVSRTEKETEKVKRLCTGPCSFRPTPLRRFSSFPPPFSSFPPAKINTVS